MDLLTTILNGVTAIPTDAYISVLGVVGFSAFQQKIKNWLELENPKVLVFMTGVFSLAGAIVPAILGWMSSSPEQLAAHSALWFTGMTLAYRYVVQPGQNYLTGLKSDYATYRNYKLNKTIAPAAAQPSAEESQAADLALEALASEPADEAVVAPTVTPGVAAEFDG